MTGGILIVIPTLNEADHIGPLLDELGPFARRTGARIVVADGGSTDGTQAIVGTRGVTLLDNPARIQGAGINLAARRFGAGAEWLIRLDAHSDYPRDYCDILLEEALATGADSIVVGMRAVGHRPVQAASAAAQNSRFGNGGAAHRIAPAGAFVDHGHHAMMRLSAFLAVGGYDESFSHNEDAELDRRLTAAGHRIWLTQRSRITYFPRKTLPALMRQYFNFGRGRAQNGLKHGLRPRARQAVAISLAPLLLLGALSPLHPAFGLPVLAWLAACLAAGIAIARGTGEAGNLLAGLAAGTMHLAWSAGYWSRLAQGLPRAARAAPAEGAR